MGMGLKVDGWGRVQYVSACGNVCVCWKFGSRLPSPQCFVDAERMIGWAESREERKGWRHLSSMDDWVSFIRKKV